MKPLLERERILLQAAEGGDKAAYLELSELYDEMAEYYAGINDYDKYEEYQDKSVEFLLKE